MTGYDKRVDTYIARAAEFAQPILQHLRDIVHSACPEVDETIKWNFPVFTHHGMLCNMAAFKQHVAFGFWKGALIDGAGPVGRGGAMGQLGRITSLKDLPPRREIVRLVKAAARLNEAGVSRPRPPRIRRPPPAVPADLKNALARDRRARNGFTSLSPSQRREYIDWLAEAKTDPTRARRLATTIEWLQEGKSRNWKYAGRKTDLSQR